MKKTFVFILILSLVFVSCSKNAKDESLANKVNSEIEAVENQQTETVHDEKTIQVQDSSVTMSVLEKGGFTVYGNAEFCDIPKECRKQEYSIFGIEGDEMPLETSPDKIEIKCSSVDNDLNYTVYIPESVYKDNPEIYLEAEHDGKTFVYKDKSPLELKTNKAMDGICYYTTYFPFVNRNLFSENSEWILKLKNSQNDELIYKEVWNRPVVSCNYVVYKDEYESPFVALDHNRVNPNEKNHLLYKGDVAVISYCCNYGRGIVYIPFVALKAKHNVNGVCDLEFSIQASGQYKVDFYDSTTSQLTETSCFDYISVSYQKDAVEFAEKKGTVWKVNSPEGLRYRDSPWGDKIGVLENATELIQTEEMQLPFSDCIDGEKGFWIPIALKDVALEIKPDSPKIYCDNPDETLGWVFSGFLTKIE